MRRVMVVPPLLVVAGLVLALGQRRAVARRRRAVAAQPRHRPPAPGDVRLSVVVPAFREERIGATVARLRDELHDVEADGGLEVIVVDDGSGDDTPERAAAAGADEVVRLPRNRGKGAAVRAGVLAAHGRSIAFTDADLSYAPDQIRVVLDAVEHGWDLAVGSRRHAATTTLTPAGRLRDLGGRLVNRCTRLVLTVPREDTQCGLKAFRSDVARLLFGRARIDGFAFDVEVLLLAERYGLAVQEVPVVVRNYERSTVRVARDALRLLVDLLRLRLWAWSGAYPAPSGADLAAAQSAPGQVPVRRFSH